MKAYKENPKTKGSGIVCAIPQTGLCPNKCEDCFFQSGRSYLEPLQDNLPNMPEPIDFQVIRVNDGNDSNVKRRTVLRNTSQYKYKFYNTAFPNLNFPGPVVFTVNPAVTTNLNWWKLASIPQNLMFVRFRTNTWNLDLADDCIKFYTSRDVPVVLTFMAYFNTVDSINEKHRINYVYRKRFSNSYHAIITKAWRKIMDRYKDNKWVYSCGKIEGELGDTHCRFCGNCLREYFATMERMGT